MSQVVYGPVWEQFFPAFQLFVWPERSNISIRKTLVRIRKCILNLLKWFKMWNTSGKEFASERVAAAHIARIIYFICSSFRSCIWLFIQVVTNTVAASNSSRHQRFMREKFFKMKLVKTFLRNSMTRERLIAMLYFQLQGYELKNRFRLFRWWIWQST